MHSEEDLWRGAVKEFAANTRQHLDDHPTDEEFEFLATGGLPSPRLELVREHVVFCQPCLSKIVNQRTFPFIEPPSRTSALSEGQVEERWRKVRSQLFAPVDPRKELASRHAGRLFFGHPIASALAAVVAIAFVGLTVFLFRSGTWLSWMRRPMVNTQIVSLVPDESDTTPITRGSRAQTQTATILPFADSILFTLAVPSLEEFPAYSLEVFKEGSDEPIWMDSSIRRTENFNFNVSFRRSDLPEGGYAIRLWGQPVSGRRLVASFRVKVAYQR